MEEFEMLGFCGEFVPGLRKNIGEYLVKERSVGTGRVEMVHLLGWWLRSVRKISGNSSPKQF